MWVGKDAVGEENMVGEAGVGLPGSGAPRSLVEGLSVRWAGMWVGESGGLRRQAWWGELAGKRSGLSAEMDVLTRAGCRRRIGS